MKSSILTASRNVQYEAKYDVSKDSIPARRAMSKNLRPIQLIPAAFVLILQFFTFAAGQDIEATIRVDPNLANVVTVRGRFVASATVGLESHKLVLLNQYGDLPSLAKRFSNIRLFSEEGEMGCISDTAGEYRCTKPIVEFWYRADLVPTNYPGSRVHTSWMKDSAGVLVVDDLMPQGRGKSARLKVELPSDWPVYFNGASTVRDAYEIPDIEKVVLVLGKGWRIAETATKQASITILLTGKWQFSDQDAANLTAEIYDVYDALFGARPNRPVQIAISDILDINLRNPWEGGTRGRSILLASSDMPFRSQSLQRLHEQLRHEIFHLWIPNGVKLTGNYDWFYEGFALYQSLKMGVAVNRIRFDDYLDTLSRAYAIDARQSNRTSMIEASRNRWNGSNTDVYARGMLVAFLSDLAMLEASKGKRSTTDLLREIYSKYGGEARSEDGNAAILAIMKRYPELIPITERYVTGAEKLDWGSLIKSAGIDAYAKDGRLSVSAKLSGRQKDLLDKLGYNNWRKLANEKR